MRGWAVATLRWLPALAYFAATSLGHLAFTEWLLRPRENAWLGSYSLKNAVPTVLVVAGLCLLAWIVRTARRDPQGPWTPLGCWALWFACVAMVDRLLTYSVYEYAHYPQYALLACLVAWALDPQRTGRHGARVLFWTTLLGMVDECMQYLWITPSYGNYLDFNDFVVNLLGAAAGVMLLGGHRHGVPQPLRVEGVVVVGLGVVVTVAMLSGRLLLSPPPGTVVPAGGQFTGADGVARLALQRAPDWYGSRQVSPHRGAYRVLSPGAGLLVLVLLGVVFGRSTAPTRSATRPALPHAG